MTVSTGDMCNIPNMALSSPLYSTADNPFGLPGDLRSVGRRLVFIPVLAQQSTTANTAVQFNPVTNVSFTVPMNCSAIKLCLFNTSINAGTGNTLVFKFYNGSVASGTELMQINNTTANGYMSACELVPVVPGETINLNCGWSATAGTSVWSGGAARQTPAIWVETA